METQKSSHLLERALVLHQGGDVQSAIQHYREILAEQPTADVYANLGVALRTLGKTQAALVAYQQALNLNPNHVAALSNWGGGLRALGKLNEAIPILEKAIALDPAFIAAHHNLGLVYMDHQQPEKAIACFEQVLELNPNRVDAQFDRATCLLQLGRYQEGFQAYESRFGYEPRLVKPYAQPKWDGSPLNGKTLLLYAEQGFGDTLQFCRYIPLIEKAGGRIILECPQPLKRLMATVAGVDQVVAPGDQLPAFDCHTSLLSLPHLFQTELKSIPATFPYLKAPFYRLGVTRRLGTQLKIGLVWGSGHSDVGVRNRAIPLTAFAPLLALPDITWVSLQKGPQTQQIKQLGFECLLEDWGSRIQDFADTAAVLEELDLLITADTAIVHLAGAMNKPCWVLLPYGSEWRWLLDGEHSPWYPRLTLFRSQPFQTWESLVGRVVTRLEADLFSE